MVILLVKNNLHSTVMLTNIFTSKYNLQKVCGHDCNASHLKGNITAKYWSNPIKSVPSIDAFDTHVETSSLIKHRMGWLRISERFHHFDGEMSKQIRGMSTKVEKRFTPNKLPTNLKRNGKSFVNKQ